MELLKTIKEEDAYPGIKPEEPAEWKDRKAVRAVLFDDDNKIALLNASKYNYYKLPGGGIEGLESTEDALKRECLEEVGCKVAVGREFGRILEWRNKIGVKQESYCYIAKLDGAKGVPELEQDEMEAGFETTWVDIDEAVKLVESSKPNTYDGPFIIIRDAIFIKKAKNLIEK